MSDESKCPKCGAGFLRWCGNGDTAIFQCGTWQTGIELCESDECLRRQLAQANEKIERLRGIVEDLVYQFGSWSAVAGGYWTAGLSALERAFAALGWDDPHIAPDACCDEPGCKKQASWGFPTKDGYRRTCTEHHEAAEAAQEKKP